MSLYARSSGVGVAALGVPSLASHVYFYSGMRRILPLSFLQKVSDSTSAVARCSSGRAEGTL